MTTSTTQKDLPTLAEHQESILKEIAEGIHTTTKQQQWQAATQKTYYYYHCHDGHESHSCFTMNRALTKANKPNNINPGPTGPATAPTTQLKSKNIPAGQHTTYENISTNPFNILTSESNLDKEVEDNRI